MPRRRVVDSGHETNRAVRAASSGADGGNGGLASVPGVPSGPARIEAATSAFAWLMARTDGWLRAAPDKDGKTNHFKWKFNSARWPNHYVYYSAPVGAWAEGICGLALKVAEVDSGERRPTFDTYYNPL